MSRLPEQVMERLSQDDMERYQRDGVMFPISVMSAAKARAYRRAFEQIEAINGEPFKRFVNAHLFFRWAFEIATEPAVLDAVSCMLGDELLINGTLMFCKSPHDPACISWHQDSAYYSNWQRWPMVTAWIALSDSTIENGCMRVIPGSHTAGMMTHRERPSATNLLSRSQEIQAHIDETNAMDVVLRAGEMSLHHCSIIHGSGPNKSYARRIGFIVRYVTDEVETSSYPVTRARGCSDCSCLNLLEPPADDDISQAFKTWRDSR